MASSSGLARTALFGPSSPIVLWYSIEYLNGGHW